MGDCAGRGDERPISHDYADTTGMIKGFGPPTIVSYTTVFRTNSQFQYHPAALLGEVHHLSRPFFTQSTSIYLEEYLNNNNGTACGYRGLSGDRHNRSHPTKSSHCSCAEQRHIRPPKEDGPISMGHRSSSEHGKLQTAVTRPQA